MYLSALTYHSDTFSTDDSLEELSFCPTLTLLCPSDPRVLTVKPSSSDPELEMTPGTYAEFTVMLLYKIGSGTITTPVNLVSIPSSLSVSFFTTT